MKLRKPKHLRRSNKRLILNTIRQHKTITKSEIAEKINISKQTINNIVRELLKEKLVIEVGLGKSTEEGGKRPVLLKFNENAGFIIGCMMGPKKIKAILTNYNTNIVTEKYFHNNIKAGPEEIISKMVIMFEDIIREAGISREQILGIGIGVPGIVNEEEGIIRLLPYMTHWESVKIAKIIENRMGIKVSVSNENRVRCYGEKMFGLANKLNNFVVIVTGYGIGGGVFIDSQCLTGKNLFAGEVGHMKLATDGPECVCGNRGCLNSLANTVRINDLIKEHMDMPEYQDSRIARRYKDSDMKITPKMLLECFCSDDDSLAKLVSDEITYWLGVGVSLITANLDPELIVISGEYAAGGNCFLNKIKKVAENNILPSVEKEINIKYSTLGKKSGLLGAAGMVLDKLL